MIAMYGWYCRRYPISQLFSYPWFVDDVNHALSGDSDPWVVPP